MKVSVFKPSREFIARLEIESIHDLPGKLQELLTSGTRIPMRSRVEAPEQCWTITGFNPVQLREEAQPLPQSSEPAPVIETEWRRQAPRSAARRQMMVGLCWCVGGTVVTGASYVMADSGPGRGSYIVAWGAILFGAIRFLRGFANLRDR